MNALLNEFLLSHHELPLDGVGVLRVASQPAQYDVTERAFMPPAAALSFEPLATDDSVSMQPLVRFVAQQMQQSEEEACENVMQWQKETSLQLQQGEAVAIGIFGTLQQQDGQIVFSPATLQTGFEPIAAERVIRESAVHQMLVGDVETNSTEMEAYYDQQEKATDRWWLLPVIVAVVAIALIVWAKFLR
jgi:hypothetical protein